MNTTTRTKRKPAHPTRLTGRIGRLTGYGVCSLLPWLIASVAMSGEKDPVPKSTSELKQMSLDDLTNYQVTSVSKKEEKLSQAASAIQVISQEDILRDLLHNRDAAAIFEELTREFQRMGFRFDDGFVRHVFFRGGGIVFGGIFFGGPFTWARRADREYPGFGRRIEPWGPWLRRTGEGERPGLFTRLGRALQGVISGLGRVARFALGAGEWGEDIRHDLPITPEEARQGIKKRFRFTRGTEIEEVVVTVPPGVRPGTQLRLRGKGLIGKTGEPGDLYLRVTLAE